MKLSHLLFCSVLFLASCANEEKDDKQNDVQPLSAVLENYFEERLRLFPLEATLVGDTRYNDLLPLEFTDSYRAKLLEFYNRYLAAVRKYDREKLDEKDKLNFDVFVYTTNMNIEELGFSSNNIPFNQYYALPLSLGQMGSGEGSQPFKTAKDYEDWLKRAAGFKAWSDTAILYFQKGLNAQYVLPKSLVVKMIPQMKAMVSSDITTSVFYGPVKNMPASFSDSVKQHFTTAYTKLIRETLEPAYTKLANFLEKNYLPLARTTSGISALPGGNDYYKFLVRQQTTTSQTPEEIYNTGLKEVARIKALMDSVKNSTGFAGDLNSFFAYMTTDKKFTPFRSPKEVLSAFENIHQRMLPFVSKMFTRGPKTPFEIRQTEAFRAASASAEYLQGSADGSRPGIFYIPILDATTFNVTSGMESLFLHEAIPGHHYQLSLSQEDSLLPRFLRFGGNNAYVEGWALYCESLGKELGLYADPYQYMGALGDEMHRAIRLVVDVGLHAKNMTREQAIKYMRQNEAISEQGATAEIERYMAIPGQALGYKIGALKIKALRERYEKELGSKFSLAAFHDEVLKDGSLPLDVLESKMNAWAEQQK